MIKKKLHNSSTYISFDLGAPTANPAVVTVYRCKVVETILASSSPLRLAYNDGMGSRELKELSKLVHERRGERERKFESVA